MNTHLAIGRDVALTSLLIAVTLAACMVLAHFLDPVPPISAEPNPRASPAPIATMPYLRSRDSSGGARGTQ